jgi:hypothetical protein
MSKISIIIPAHNEEENLHPLMDELLPAYPAAKMISNRAFNNSNRLLFGIKHKDNTFFP